jgi:hypothetical protein
MEAPATDCGSDLPTILAIFKNDPKSRSVNNLFQRLDLDPSSISLSLCIYIYIYIHTYIYIYICGRPYYVLTEHLDVFPCESDGLNAFHCNSCYGMPMSVPYWKVCANVRLHMFPVLFEVLN